MKKIRRTHIINYLVKRNDYLRYLEIGVRSLSTFSKIKCKYKEGVDPSPIRECKYVMTSDDFFKQKMDDKLYDIVLIDGLHLHEQVLRDVENSLKCLSKNGTIVMHDCNPLSIEAQTGIFSKRPAKWNGDVWKAFAFLRMTRKDLSMYVVDTDHGCGIIKFGKQKLFKKHHKELNYDFLNSNRVDILNLCSVKEFYKREKGR